MSAEDHTKSRRQPVRMPAWLGFCLFLVIAAFFLLKEHRAHVFGVLPFLLLLLCPVIHFFMHRGHGAGGHGQPDTDGRDAGDRHRDAS